MARVSQAWQAAQGWGWGWAGPQEDPGQIGCELGRKSVFILEFIESQTSLEMHGHFLALAQAR